MKFTCQKNELAGAISIVSKALSSKPQMPILSGIYLPLGVCICCVRKF